MNAADNPQNQNESSQIGYAQLSPSRVCDAVEHLSVRCTGATFGLNSVENRVYDVELETEERVIAKFYRPGRWSKEAILEEHAYMQSLADAEVPSVPAMQFPSGSTVSTIDDLYFAVFQRVRGRSLVELDDEQLRWLGRLIGRMHGVSQSKTYEHRPAFNSERMTENLELILASTHMSEAMHSRYKQIGESLLNIVGPKLDAIKKFPIHGDCHLANVLWNESGPYFVDFDDTRVGPAVQDLWMLVQGKDEHSKKQLEHLVSGYELFCEFDRASLSLIEPLRAYRIIYYSAWIVRRWHDPAFPKLFPHFGTEQYWNEEITALSELLGEVSYSY